MNITFDPDKDALNKAKHGVSLKVGVELFDDDDKLIEDAFRKQDGEARERVIGLCRGKLFTAIYV